MYANYDKAHSTIVLSASLLNTVARKTGHLELEMHISMSSWMKRSWCFPKAVLGLNLYFAFEDDLVNVEDLDSQYVGAASESVFANSACAFYVNLLRQH
jgi:hypothetical protein